MGVYGYSKDFGKIPEGYLNVCINQTKNDVDILYPANPGSVYHMTKCLDQLLFQFYNKKLEYKLLTSTKELFGELKQQDD